MSEAVETGWVKVRIDTDPGEDGWCFVTPEHHPDDIKRGLVEGEWNESYQFFGQVQRPQPFHSLSRNEDTNAVRPAKDEAK